MPSRPAPRAGGPLRRVARALAKVLVGDVSRSGGATAGRLPGTNRLRRMVYAGAAITALAVMAWAARSFILERLPPGARIAVTAWRHGVSVDHDVRIATRDGVVLASSLYLPRRRNDRLPTVLIRLPYDRMRYGEGYQSAIEFARNGYAAIVQDLRGTGASTGQLMPWKHAGDDGAATLDWIVLQPWSDGRVGTFGCSALGETQFALARLNHPAHRAMIASGAGGAIGSARNRYGYFGVFEGGVFQLASGFGWFVQHGAKDAAAPSPSSFDRATHLRTLPVSSLVDRVRPYPNGYSDLLAAPLGDPRWADWGYWSDSDRSSVPVLLINTWGDQTLQDTLELAEAWRTAGTPFEVILAPGNHCGHELARDGVLQFGDLAVRNAQRPWATLYRDWFDRWLKHSPTAADQAPVYTYFVLGEDRWRTATQWPPGEALRSLWYLHSAIGANTRDGDGRLLTLPPTGAERADVFRYDPLDPVPSRGGPVCCTGDPSIRPGPVDQSEVEARSDVLVYTSDPLTDDLLIAGPVRARLAVSSDAPDTDIVTRLVHVDPDGLALGIQEGALRLRYREGFETPRPLLPGIPEIVEVDMRSIAYRVPRGHRIRLQVTSSSFPRLERNLNTGASRNADETRTALATNRVHHGGGHLSWIQLYWVPAER